MTLASFDEKMTLGYSRWYEGFFLISPLPPPAGVQTAHSGPQRRPLPHPKTNGTKEGTPLNPAVLRLNGSTRCMPPLPEVDSSMHFTRGMD
jgi:hypothetical protein